LRRSVADDALVPEGVLLRRRRVGRPPRRRPGRAAAARGAALPVPRRRGAVRQVPAGARAAGPAGGPRTPPQLQLPPRPDPRLPRPHPRRPTNDPRGGRVMSTPPQVVYVMTCTGRN